MGISNVIVTFVISALSFGGQQIGKGKEWERQQAEQQRLWAQQQVEKEQADKRETRKFLCDDKNICGPAVQYVMPGPELIGPPAP